MNIFKQAVLTQLRVPTARGNLSAEQLAQLPIEGTNNLAAIATDLAKCLAESAPTTLDFLDTSIKVDEALEARFELVKEIIKHRQSTARAKSAEAADKSHNAKIDALIAAKEEEKLSSLSVEELAKLRK